MDGVNATLNVVVSDPVPSYHFHSGDCNTDATNAGLRLRRFVLAGFVFCFWDIFAGFVSVCFCVCCRCYTARLRQASPPGLLGVGRCDRQGAHRTPTANAARAATATAPPAAREASRIRMTTDQMFDRLRELRPAAGRTILNRAGGAHRPRLARRGQPPPSRRPTRRRCARSSRCALTGSSASRARAAIRAPSRAGRRTCARRICAWRSPRRLVATAAVRRCCLEGPDGRAHRAATTVVMGGAGHRAGADHGRDGRAGHRHRPPRSSPPRASRPTPTRRRRTRWSSAARSRGRGPPR